MAAAEACGVSFLPATAAQVQRLAMQRKVFYAAGQPILATRGDGFYETAGTLQRVIEEGRQQQRDLAAWEGGEAPVEATAEPPASEPDPVPAAGAEVEEPAVPETPETVARAEDPAPRRRARRSRPAPAETDVWPFEQEPALAPPPPAVATTKAAGDAGARPQQQAGRRWVMAGAARRGRAGKHWSQRQR